MVSFKGNYELQQHTNNLVSIVNEFADYIKYDNKFELIMASQLHDIGKLWIDEDILYKKTKLTKDEMIEIKKHPYYSYTICKSSLSSSVLNAIIHHHERVDGKGYPHGLRNEEISDTTKILTICDSFEAMTGERGYRTPLTIKQSLLEIQNNLGKQFDYKLGYQFIEFQSSRGLRTI